MKSSSGTLECLGLRREVTLKLRWQRNFPIRLVNLKSCYKDLSNRLSTINKALSTGKLSPRDGQFLAENYAYIYKDGPTPTLGMGRSGSAEPSSIPGLDPYTIPFTISVYQEDRDGDIVYPMGAVYQNFSRSPGVFFGHQSIEIPVGQARSKSGQTYFWKSEDKLKSACRFDTKDSDAMMIYEKVNDGFLNSSSVAFVPIEAYKRDKYSEKGLFDKAKPHRDPGADAGWFFKSYDVTEWSIVGVGSNPGAIRDIYDSEKQYMTPRLQKGWKMYCAKSINESGGCFTGWCPCPPIKNKSMATNKTKCACKGTKKDANCGCTATKAVTDSPVDDKLQDVDKVSTIQGYAKGGEKCRRGQSAAETGCTPDPRRQQEINLNRRPNSRSNNAQGYMSPQQGRSQGGRSQGGRSQGGRSQQGSQSQGYSDERTINVAGVPITQRRSIGKVPTGQGCTKGTNADMEPARNQAGEIDRTQSNTAKRPDSIRGSQVGTNRVPTAPRPASAANKGTAKSVGLSSNSGSAGGYTVATSDKGKQQSNNGKGSPLSKTDTDGWKSCSKCSGTGNCIQCEGHGDITNEDGDRRQCSLCGGSGDCKTCKGVGNVEKSNPMRTQTKGKKAVATPPAGKDDDADTKPKPKKPASKPAAKLKPKAPDKDDDTADNVRDLDGPGTIDQEPASGQDQNTDTATAEDTENPDSTDSDTNEPADSDTPDDDDTDSDIDSTSDNDMASAGGGGMNASPDTSGDESVDVDTDVDSSLQDTAGMSGVPGVVKGSEDMPFNPKPSARGAGRLLQQYNSAASWIPEALKEMDHPGMSQRFQEHLDGPLQGAIEDVKSMIMDHHASGDADPDSYLDRLQKALETDTDATVGAPQLQPGEAGQVAGGNIPDDPSQPPTAQPATDMSQYGSEVGSAPPAPSGSPDPTSSQAPSGAGSQLPSDPNNDEILMRYETPKGWRTVKVGKVRVTKDGSKRKYLILNGSLAVINKAANESKTGEYIQGSGKSQELNEGETSAPYNKDFVADVLKDVSDFMSDMDGDDSVPKQYKSVAKHYIKQLGYVSKALQQGLTNKGKFQADSGSNTGGSTLDEKGALQRDSEGGDNATGQGGELTEAGKEQASAPSHNNGKGTSEYVEGSGKVDWNKTQNTFVKEFDSEMAGLLGFMRQTGMVGKDQ